MSVLNPGTLLPSDDNGTIQRNGLEILETFYSSRLDLSDQPITQPNWNLFTDGSSFMVNGQRVARYTVVTEQEAKALLPGTPAQRAELITLDESS